ncbi:MAG: cytochrome c [Pseudomonadota bacterium]
MKHRMHTLALMFALAAAPALAAPFASGKAADGKALHAKKCAGCHVGRFGGDGSKIYTRADRRVKNASALAQQITTCNSMLGNELFPEDEANLGAYLNQTYYKFK